MKGGINFTLGIVEDTNEVTFADRAKAGQVKAAIAKKAPPISFVDGKRILIEEGLNDEWETIALFVSLYKSSPAFNRFKNYGP